MTVSIDQSDIRTKGPVKAFALDGIVSKPSRSLLAAGLGGLGLIAFTVGAFSFFGDLADPRARKPRPKVVAVSMPDLRDGLPELASNGIPAQAAVSPVVVRPASSVEQPARELAPALAAIRSDAAAKDRPASDATGPAANQAKASDKPLPAIENAPAVRAEPRQAAVIAPLRLSNPLPPGKVETVRAKPVDERAGVATQAPKVPEPKVADQDQTAAIKRVVGAKPVREKPVRAAAADTATIARPSAPRREASEESDDLGSKVSKGIKAIGGIFSSDD